MSYGSSSGRWGAAASVGLFASLMLAMFAGLAYAAPTGTSSLSVSQNSLTLRPGATYNLNFTLTLTSGTAGQTVLVLPNANNLSRAGIRPIISPGAGTPTFSGQIIISTDSSAKPGTYTMAINSIGSDPMPGPYNITLTVPSQAGTTVNTTTAAPTTVATQPTTIQSGPAGQPGQPPYSIIVAVIVIVAVAAGAYWLWRSRSASSGSPSSGV